MLLITLAKAQEKLADNVRQRRLAMELTGPSHVKKPLPVKEMKVGLNFGAGVQSVGRLALRERKIYFEYDGAFLKSGPEISPFHLPLRSGHGCACL
ncbi:MAG: HipA N-terminal domain-containing protein [Pseudohongiella sp.]|nr:HipA N-terminal domain-containing protein [Pseudohongiella sp.]